MAAVNTNPCLPITVEQFAKAWTALDLQSTTHTIQEIYNQIIATCEHHPRIKTAIKDNQPVEFVLEDAAPKVSLRSIPEGTSWESERVPRRWYLIHTDKNPMLMGAEKQIRQGFSFTTKQLIAWTTPAQKVNLELPFDEIKFIRDLKGAPHLLWPEPSNDLFNCMITPWGGLDMAGYIEAQGRTSCSYTFFEVLTILHGLTETLEYVHDPKHSSSHTPFVFQDLKPENILIQAQDGVIRSIKIIDYTAVSPEGLNDRTGAKLMMTPFYAPTNAIIGHCHAQKELRCADDLYAVAKIAFFAFNAPSAVWIGDIEAQFLTQNSAEKIGTQYLELWRTIEIPILMQKAQDRISRYYNCADLTALLGRMLSENAADRPTATELKIFCCEALKKAALEKHTPPLLPDFWLARPAETTPPLPSRITSFEDLLPWVMHHSLLQQNSNDMASSLVAPIALIQDWYSFLLPNQDKQLTNAETSHIQEQVQQYQKKWAGHKPIVAYAQEPMLSHPLRLLQIGPGSSIRACKTDQKFYLIGSEISSGRIKTVYRAIDLSNNEKIVYAKADADFSGQTMIHEEWKYIKYLKPTIKALHLVIPFETALEANRLFAPYAGLDLSAYLETSTTVSMNTFASIFCDIFEGLAFLDNDANFSDGRKYGLTDLKLENVCLQEVVPSKLGGSAWRAVLIDLENIHPQGHFLYFKGQHSAFQIPKEAITIIQRGGHIGPSWGCYSAGTMLLNCLDSAVGDGLWTTEKALYSNRDFDRWHFWRDHERTQVTKECCNTLSSLGHKPWATILERLLKEDPNQRASINEARDTFRALIDAQESTWEFSPLLKTSVDQYVQPLPALPNISPTVIDPSYQEESKLETSSKEKKCWLLKDSNSSDRRVKIQFWKSIGDIFTNESTILTWITAGAKNEENGRSLVSLLNVEYRPRPALILSYGGVSLKTWQGTHAIPWSTKQVGTLVILLFKALHVLEKCGEQHDHHIIHTAINPDHLLITEDEESGAITNLQLCGFSRATLVDRPIPNRAPCGFFAPDHLIHSFLNGDQTIKATVDIDLFSISQIVWLLTDPKTAEPLLPASLYKDPFPVETQNIRRQERRKWLQKTIQAQFSYNQTVALKKMGERGTQLIEVEALWNQ